MEWLALDSDGMDFAVFLPDKKCFFLRFDYPPQTVSDAKIIICQPLDGKRRNRALDDAKSVSPVGALSVPPEYFIRVITDAIAQRTAEQTQGEATLKALHLTTVAKKIFRPWMSDRDLSVTSGLEDAGSKFYRWGVVRESVGQFLFCNGSDFFFAHYLKKNGPVTLVREFLPEYFLQGSFETNIVEMREDLGKRRIFTLCGILEELPEEELPARVFADALVWRNSNPAAARSLCRDRLWLSTEDPNRHVAYSPHLNWHEIRKEKSGGFSHRILDNSITRPEFYTDGREIFWSGYMWAKRQIYREIPATETENLLNLNAALDNHLTEGESHKSGLRLPEALLPRYLRLIRESRLALCLDGVPKRRHLIFWLNDSYVQKDTWKPAVPPQKISEDEVALQLQKAVFGQLVFLSFNSKSHTNS